MADILALLGLGFRHRTTRATRLSAGLGHGIDALQGLLVAAGERISDAAKGERKQDADQDDH
jgi:hypothetical protein